MPAPETKVLLLGGTAEATEMAARLHDRGIDVLTSLAGRTREPAPLKGKVRIGGFGGAKGLATFMLENNIHLLIDMTHPFATRMSENARQASNLTGVPLFAFHRPGWEKLNGDDWIEVPDIASAVAVIPSGAMVLLALGSQQITPFSSRTDVHFLVRMVDQPTAPLPFPDHALLLARPGSVEEEFSLLQSRKVTHIVCRNSGGKASYTKIAAARLLGLPVIIIGRNRSSAVEADFETFVHSVETRIAVHSVQQ